MAGFSWRVWRGKGRPRATRGIVEIAGSNEDSRGKKEHKKTKKKHARAAKGKAAWCGREPREQTSAGRSTNVKLTVRLESNEALGKQKQQQQQ